MKNLVTNFLTKKIFISAVILSSVFFSGCSLEKPSEISEKIFSPSLEKQDSQLKKLVEQEQKNKAQKNAELVLRVVDTEKSDTEKTRVEVVLLNPDQNEIQSIQAWFVYPVSVLKGEKITLLQKDIFPIVAPNEKNFDRKNGIVKLGFSAEGKAKKTESEIVLAEIEFSHISNNPFQFELFSGHTKVMTFSKNGVRDILK